MAAEVICTAEYTERNVMGSSYRIEVNTLKILPTKCGAFVQETAKSVDFRVKRSGVKKEY